MGSVANARFGLPLLVSFAFLFMLLASAFPAQAFVDSVPPALTVLSPDEGAVMPDDRPFVFGATEPGATVTVNGHAADVNFFDGTFSLRDFTVTRVSLTSCTEPATLSIVARDPAGNERAITRGIIVNHCGFHPSHTTPLPELTIATGTASVPFDLPSHFADDGGVDQLIFSTYVTGAASGAISVSYSSGALAIVWMDDSFVGRADVTVIAVDRGGEFSDPATLVLNVVETPPPNEPPSISFDVPAEGAWLPAGGTLDLVVYGSDPEQGRVTLAPGMVSPGIHVGAIQWDTYAWLFRVHIFSDPGVALGGGLSVEFVATDEAYASARAAVSLRAYDPKVPLATTLEIPSSPEVSASARIEGPGPQLGVWVEFSTSRPVPALWFLPTCPVCDLDEPVPKVVPLNDEHTYWRTFVQLPSVPGSATVTMTASDRALTGEDARLTLILLSPPVVPSLGALVPIGGGDAPVEGTAVSYTWTGLVPDLDQTAFEWRVDGQLASTDRVLDGVILDEGTHSITLTVTSPGGSSTASATIGVGARPSIPLAPAPSPIPLYLAIAGLVVVGLVLAGTEIGIYFLVSTLLGVLIDRQQREKLLAHFVRGRIYQIIEYEPGIHLSELQRKANAARGVCAYHLHALEKAGLVKSLRDGMFLRFTTTKVPVDPSTYALAAEDREFLRLIEAKPGITERELAEALTRSSGSVARTAAKLAKSGYLEVRRDGANNAYFPRTQTPGAAPAGP